MSSPFNNLYRNVGVLPLSSFPARFLFWKRKINIHLLDKTKTEVTAGGGARSGQLCSGAQDDGGLAVSR